MVCKTKQKTDDLKAKEKYRHLEEFLNVAECMSERLPLSVSFVSGAAGEAVNPSGGPLPSFVTQGAGDRSLCNS